MAKKMSAERLDSGILLKDALNVTRDFLEWLGDHLRENEPYATVTMRTITDVMAALPDDIEDFGKTSDELDAEFAKEMAVLAKAKDSHA